MNRKSPRGVFQPWRSALGALIGLMVFPSWVAAQVAVGLTLSSDKAHRYEDIVATVVIQNHSGQMLVIDSAQGPVRFWIDVKRDDGRMIARRDNAPLMSAVKMMPGESRPFGFNVTRLYAIRNQGLYKIRAGVEINGTPYASPEATLEVDEGFELQRLTAGVPGDARAVRTYILSYLQKSGVENIYLMIEDADKAVYGLFNLGRVVRVRPPEMKVDEVGNVHVLFQTAGMVFVHAAFTAYGVQLFAKTYMGTRGQASLEQQPNGQITVPNGIEMATPPELTPEEKAAVDKARKKVGTGGMIGQFLRPQDQTP